MIAARGGFEGVKAGPAEAAYWLLKGNRSAEKIQAIKDIALRGKEAEAGLARLVEAFADPTTPYQAVPKPANRPRYDDYAQLARLAEWGRIMGEGG